MADEGKIAAGVEAVMELAAAVPVHSDALQPATATRAVGVALAPLRDLIWHGDRIIEYVQDWVAIVFRDKPERLITPSPVVAIPILQALQYTTSIDALREMYLKLLAASMDKETAHKAHPAFVEVIRQLAPDEARMLKTLSVHVRLPVITVLEVVHRGSAERTERTTLRNFSLIPDLAGCAHLELGATYLDNIQRLGLAEVNDRKLSEPGTYEPLYDHPRVKGVRDKLESEQRPTTSRADCFEVTDFGRQFCDACLPPDAKGTIPPDGEKPNHDPPHVPL